MKNIFGGGCILLDIKPVKYEGLDCLDSLLSTIAAYWGHQYELSFAQTWRFDYISSKDNTLTLGKRIVQNSNTIIKLFKNYHNIALTRYYNYDVDLLNNIKSNIQRSIPVGVWLDHFWTPWHESFKTAHGSHSFLIIGYDESNNLICTDPYYLKENCILTPEQLRNGYKSHVFFHLKGNEEKIINWGSIIINNLNATYSKDFPVALYNNIQKFANEILNNFNIKTETDGYKIIEQAPIIWNLAYVMINRKRYSCMLNYLGKKYSADILHTVAEKLEMSYNYWSEVRALVLKSYFDNSLKIEANLYEKIMKIANYENNIAVELLNACHNL